MTISHIMERRRAGWHAREAIAGLSDTEMLENGVDFARALLREFRGDAVRYGPGDYDPSGFAYDLCGLLIDADTRHAGRGGGVGSLLRTAPRRQRLPGHTRGFFGEALKRVLTDKSAGDQARELGRRRSGPSGNPLVPGPRLRISVRGTRVRTRARYRPLALDRSSQAAPDLRHPRPEAAMSRALITLPPPGFRGQKIVRKSGLLPEVRRTLGDLAATCRSILCTLALAPPRRRAPRRAPHQRRTARRSGGSRDGPDGDIGDAPGRRLPGALSQIVGWVTTTPRLLTEARDGC